MYPTNVSFKIDLIILAVFNSRSVFHRERCSLCTAVPARGRIEGALIQNLGTPLYTTTGVELDVDIVVLLTLLSPPNLVPIASRPHQLLVPFLYVEIVTVKIHLHPYIVFCAYIYILMFNLCTYTKIFFVDKLNIQI